MKQTFYFLIAIISLLGGGVYAAALPDINVHPQSKKAHLQTAVAGNQHVYSRDDLQQQGGVSPRQFLENQGLVQLTSQTANADQVAIDLRGFGVTGSQNTLLLIDGLPFTSSSVVGANINSVLLDNIASINIMPGSYGSLYGDQAVGGVVAISTLTPTKPVARLHLGLGNHGQALGGLFVSRHFTNGFGFNLGAQGYNTHGFQVNSKQRERTLNAKLQYTGSQGMVSVNVISFKHHVLLPNSRLWGGDKPDLATGNYINSDGNLAYIIGKYYMTPHWWWLGRFSHNDTKAFSQTTKFLSTTHQHAWRLQNQLHYQQRSLAGIDVYGDRYDLQNQAQNKQVNSLQTDIYLHNKLPLNKQWQLVLGTRYAHQHTQAQIYTTNLDQGHDEHALATEQGIIFKPTKKLSFYLRRDTNFRFAKADERAWTAANIQHLQTQKGQSYELGGQWHEQNSQIKMSIYRLDLTNELAYDPIATDDAPFGKINNLPPTRRYGIDFSARYALTSTINTLLQVSAVDAKFSAGIYQGNRIPMVSRYHASAALQYHDQNGWRATLVETYASSFFADDDLTNQGQRFSGYFLTNIFLHKQIKTLGIGLRINNLFDKHYVRYASFSGPSQTYYYPANGLNVLASLDIDLS